MEPLLGTILAFAFDYEPRGWMKCDGRLLPIQRYSALFSLLGTAYGGDGVQTFGLPDLRGRVAVGMGTGPDRLPVNRGEAIKPQSLDVARATPGTNPVHFAVPQAAQGVNYCIAVEGLWPSRE